MSPAGFLTPAVAAHLTRFYIDPEVDYVYSGAVFNDQIQKLGPVALVALARHRADARRERKRRNRARYQRMNDRHRRYAHPTKYRVVAEEIADNLFQAPP